MAHDDTTLPEDTTISDDAAVDSSSDAGTVGDPEIAPEASETDHIESIDQDDAAPDDSTETEQSASDSLGTQDDEAQSDDETAEQGEGDTTPGDAASSADQDTSAPTSPDVEGAPSDESDERDDAPYAEDLDENGAAETTSEAAGAEHESVDTAEGSGPGSETSDPVTDHRPAVVADEVGEAGTVGDTEVLAENNADESIADTGIESAGDEDVAPDEADVQEASEGLPTSASEVAAPEAADPELPGAPEGETVSIPGATEHSALTEDTAPAAEPETQNEGSMGTPDAGELVEEPLSEDTPEESTGSTVSESAGPAKTEVPVSPVEAQDDASAEQASSGTAPDENVPNDSKEVPATVEVTSEAADSSAPVETDAIEDKTDTPEPTRGFVSQFGDDFAPALSFPAGGTSIGSSAPSFPAAVTSEAPTLSFPAGASAMSAPVEPTPPVTANRAPNWYPDPEDQDGTLCRWWDGSAWTEHTRVVAAAPVASRWSRRSLLALVAALVIGLVLGGGGIYTFLSRNTEAPPVAAPTTDPAASDPADTDPAAPETPGTPGGGEAPAGESVPAPPAPPAPPADVTPPVVVEIPAEPVVVNMPPLVPAPESATVPITSLMSVYVGLWRSDNSAEIPQLAALQGVLSAAAPAAGDAPGMRGYLATQCPQVTQLGTFRALGASAPEDPVIRTHLNNYFLLAQAATDVCAAAPNASDAQVLVYGPQLADLLAQASTAHAGFTARLNEHPTQ